jgi:hypothetical protein
MQLWELEKECWWVQLWVSWLAIQSEILWVVLLVWLMVTLLACLLEITLETLWVLQWVVATEVEMEVEVPRCTPLSRGSGWLQCHQ